MRHQYTLESHLCLEEAKLAGVIVVTALREKNQNAAEIEL